MKHILIVDDNDDNLYLLHALLTGSGHEVEQAHNGGEALQKALAKIPDMIISDILMPVMDGFTLCKRVKADERLKQIPFVFYTATYTDPRDEKLALNMGADAFIVKPAQPDEFLLRIEETLAANRNGKLTSSQKPAAGETVVLKEYNEALVRKLEHKMLELEQASKALENEMAARNQAEDILRASEYRMAEAQRVAHFGNWELDLLTRKLVWSDEVFRIFEIKNEGFGASYEAFLAAIHPEDRETVNAAYTKSLENRTPYSVTHRLLMPDGRIKHVWEQCKTDYSPEGKPLRSVGTVQDITERIITDDAIQEAERKFKIIFDSASDGILIARFDDKTFFMANGRICEMLSYTNQELLKLSVSDIHPEESLPRVIQQFEMLWRKEILIAREIPVMRKDRTLFFADITSSSIILDGKECLVGMFRDITERKQAEEQIRQMNKELERRVAERTAELEDAVTRLGELNRVFVGRELKMAELKKRIAELEKT